MEQCVSVCVCAPLQRDQLHRFDQKNLAFTVNRNAFKEYCKAKRKAAYYYLKGLSKRE